MNRTADRQATRFLVVDSSAKALVPAALATLAAKAHMMIVQTAEGLYFESVPVIISAHPALAVVWQEWTLSPSLPGAEARRRRRVTLVDGRCPCGAVRPMLSRQRERAALRMRETYMTTDHATDCPAGEDLYWLADNEFQVWQEQFGEHIATMQPDGPR